MPVSTDEMFDKAKTLSKDPDDNFLDLARTLRQLHDRDVDKFTEVWQNSDLDRRKAYYLVDISRAYESLPIPRARLKKIGWTKLASMAKQVTADNWQEMLELAEKTATKQLEKIMRGQTPVTNAHCVMMYFSPKEYKVLEEALLKNGGERSGRGIINKEKALIKALKSSKAASAE
jgi:hypothetical protein